ncbi:Zinc-regulated transporter 1 [Fulvia fulva]|uniref:Zinc-regulated transporter 1 n=1 Tax=Passalora fulva TaxID=5499 RepID=A0A9Q8P907_PASFU|nr:Zinc-regulated transporter 1 [Fulvia fulva]KAK4624267.1 Zinc-regulated transporter 1 [Fulvia fulva]KAK4625681.1 Zinc-regulated transporter 1 [Fulvia fulva]UJO17653.1 Zinc-regulated transporter 1 [Fulvia fulva]WPV14894.1 Zinc-regulated transporter 1 [Fulvia fulva]WPV30255.1 Zinc-regulated transporter 1 [Fulvia fulva]
MADTASNTRPGDISASYPSSGNSGVVNAMNAGNVNLTEVVAQDLVREVVCYIESGEAPYDGTRDGARISAIFVVLILSSAVTFFPVMATKMKSLRIPLYAYLFARYFGAGVIIATAFIHLLDPAYAEIGPNTCVGMTGGWAEFSWVPAIALASAMSVFLMDFYAERYVEKKYGIAHGPSVSDAQAAMRVGSVDAAALRYDDHGRRRSTSTHQHLHSGDQDPQPRNVKDLETGKAEKLSLSESEEDALADRAFKQQIAAFLILEFGVIFHSVIIGLTLGSAGDEFKTLYIVVVFHQSFEGLGIGARLSAIPFPKKLNWLPYALCAGYGLTTPIAIAAGFGVRTTYNPGSFTASTVSGVLDATSAGILLYTGFVELLARDFLFNPDRTNDDKQLTYMIFCVLLGAGVMALLGKWA